MPRSQKSIQPKGAICSGPVCSSTVCSGAVTPPVVRAVYQDYYMVALEWDPPAVPGKKIYELRWAASEKYEFRKLKYCESDLSKFGTIPLDERETVGNDGPLLTRVVQWDNLDPTSKLKTYWFALKTTAETGEIPPDTFTKVERLYWPSPWNLRVEKMNSDVVTLVWDEPAKKTILHEVYGVAYEATTTARCSAVASGNVKTKAPTLTIRWEELDPSNKAENFCFIVSSITEKKDIISHSNLLCVKRERQSSKGKSLHSTKSAVSLKSRKHEGKSVKSLQPSVSMKHGKPDGEQTKNLTVKPPVVKVVRQDDLLVSFEWDPPAAPGKKKYELHWAGSMKDEFRTEELSRFGSFPAGDQTKLVVSWHYLDSTNKLTTFWFGVKTYTKSSEIPPVEFVKVVRKKYPGSWNMRVEKMNIIGITVAWDPHSSKDHESYTVMYGAANQLSGGKGITSGKLNIKSTNFTVPWELLDPSGQADTFCFLVSSMTSTNQTLSSSAPFFVKREHPIGKEPKVDTLAGPQGGQARDNKPNCSRSQKPNDVEVFCLEKGVDENEQAEPLIHEIVVNDAKLTGLEENKRSSSQVSRIFSFPVSSGHRANDSLLGSLKPEGVTGSAGEASNAFRGFCKLYRMSSLTRNLYFHAKTFNFNNPSLNQPVPEKKLIAVTPANAAPFKAQKYKREPQKISFPRRILEPVHPSQQPLTVRVVMKDYEGVGLEWNVPDDHVEDYAVLFFHTAGRKSEMCAMNVENYGKITVPRPGITLKWIDMDPSNSNSVFMVGVQANIPNRKPISSEIIRVIREWPKNLKPPVVIVVNKDAYSVSLEWDPPALQGEKRYQLQWAASDGTEAHIRNIKKAGQILLESPRAVIAWDMLDSTSELKTFWFGVKTFSLSAVLPAAFTQVFRREWPRPWNMRVEKINCDGVTIAWDKPAVEDLKSYGVSYTAVEKPGGFVITSGKKVTVSPIFSVQWDEMDPSYRADVFCFMVSAMTSKDVLINSDVFRVKRERLNTKECQRLQNEPESFKSKQLRTRETKPDSAKSKKEGNETDSPKSKKREDEKKTGSFEFKEREEIQKPNVRLVKQDCYTVSLEWDPPAVPGEKKYELHWAAGLNDAFKTKDLTKFGSFPNDGSTTAVVNWHEMDPTNELKTFWFGVKTIAGTCVIPPGEFLKVKRRDWPTSWNMRVNNVNCDYVSLVWDEPKAKGHKTYAVAYAASENPGREAVSSGSFKTKTPKFTARWDKMDPTGRADDFCFVVSSMTSGKTLVASSEKYCVKRPKR